MKLSRETNYKEFSLPKTQNTNNNTRKTIGCFAETIGCLYQFANIKTEFKEIKERENAHKCLYWFTINLELHPVFSETTKNTTNQSNLDHLQHNQESDLDPLKTHTSLGQHTNTKNVDLDPFKNTQHFSTNTQRFLFNRYKDYTYYKSNSEINTSRNHMSHSLINLNL